MRSFKRINRYNRKGLKTGYWEDYWDDGKLESSGNFVNGKREGIWEYYHENGKLDYRELYESGNFIKIL